MKRRQLVQAAIGGLVLAGAGAWAGGYWAWLKPEMRPDLAQSLVEALNQRGHAAAIGRAVIAADGAAMDSGRLASRLAARLRRAGCEPTRAAPAEIRAAVSREVRTDFANGRVVDVRGWILSETEAELCALAARLA